MDRRDQRPAASPRDPRPAASRHRQAQQANRTIPLSMRRNRAPSPRRATSRIDRGHGGASRRRPLRERRIAALRCRRRRTVRARRRRGARLERSPRRLPARSVEPSTPRRDSSTTSSCVASLHRLGKPWLTGSAATTWPNTLPPASDSHGDGEIRTAADRSRRRPRPAPRAGHSASHSPLQPWRRGTDLVGAAEHGAIGSERDEQRDVRRSAAGSRAGSPERSRRRSQTAP